MVKLVFRTQDGETLQIEAQRGSMMQAAVASGVPGIDADCGGSMVCGTCHVYVERAWLDRLPAASEMEREILDCVPEPHPDARLSCQIAVSEAIDGICVRLPARQR